MKYLNSILYILLCDIFYVNPENRYVTVDVCNCDGLFCSCCFINRLPVIAENNVCLNLEGDPDELTLRVGLTFNDKPVISETLDPSSSPICLPEVSRLCLAINHVSISDREFCLKLTEGPFTLAKFPCVSLQDGIIQTHINTYV